MKYAWRGLAAALAAVLCLTVPVCAVDSGSGTLQHKESYRLTEGFTYTDFTYADGASHQAGHSLRLRKDSTVRPIYMACDTIWGGLTLTECMAYAESQGYQVVGGVNTDFFNTPGVPIGIVVENGELRSGNHNFNAFAILKNGGYYVSRQPEVRFTLTGPGLPDGGHSLTRMNKLFMGDELHLYSSAYSTVSTRVSEDAWAVRMNVIEGNLVLGGKLTLTVEEVLPEVQEVPIGENMLVLTAPREGIYAQTIGEFFVGQTLTLDIACSDSLLQEAEFVTGAGDLLISEGRITDSSQWSPFVGGAHPRTLLGWTAEDELVVYVADGRKEGYAAGLTLRMAAEEMLRQGCVYAVNLDGGGSSVLSAILPGDSSPRIASRPSDGGLRRSAGYLLFVTDEPHDGLARNLHLRENNGLVVAGQTITLHPYATDGALLPSQLPQGPVTINSERGSVSGDRYTAPLEGGTDRLSLYGDMASGTGTLRVIGTLDAVSVTERFGSVPEKLLLPIGASPRLQLRAEYAGKPYPIDWTAARYTLTGISGHTGPDGRFVAEGIPGTVGSLTITLAGHSLTVPVELTGPLPGNPGPTAIDFYRENTDFRVKLSP